MDHQETEADEIVDRTSSSSEAISPPAVSSNTVQNSTSFNPTMMTNGHSDLLTEYVTSKMIQMSLYPTMTSSGSPKSDHHYGNPFYPNDKLTGSSMGFPTSSALTHVDVNNLFGQRPVHQNHPSIIPPSNFHQSYPPSEGLCHSFGRMF